ncbi:MAG: hypothetical protein HY697_02310, partial [Deltaproteobacteria bacterium]|nr:hypothetical protein [Deltaproteobacteria bacterium]
MRGRSLFQLLVLGLGIFLCAPAPQAGEAVPVSGTPRLHAQKLRLVRDLKAGSIRWNAERRGELRADQVGDVVTFWAFDFGAGREAYYQTTAVCRSVSQISTGNLNIYVEEGQTLPDAVIAGIRDTFTNTILPTETNYFGPPPSGDFTIFILDIRDDYDPPANTTFVSGYFDPRNEIATTHSNERHLIYMDLNPGQPGTSGFYGTLAHEFQHYIHFSYDPQEATWVDEGLAGLARFVCGFGHPTSHVNAFTAAPSTSLIIWNDQLANYGATYLFMLYLAEHHGGAATTRRIVANTGRGLSGINSALSQSGQAVTVNDIFKNWVVANYLNDLSLAGGIYGYADSFNGVSRPPGNLQLTSSTGVYPASGSGTVAPFAADYIRFLGLGGTYDRFTLIPYNLSESAAQSYSYSGTLGSLNLTLSGLGSTLVMSGVQQGSSNATPQVAVNLGANITVSTSGGVTGSGGGGGG